MKEKTLITIKKQVESLINVSQFLINENTRLRELSVGTLETVKLLPGYQEAIDQLKKNVEEKNNDETSK
mgnify:CR=1 FL=1|tara:strand:+ start:815 stop:1021 length:207 start_codon:yes stop_codon:yes gene_type:complete